MEETHVCGATVADRKQLLHGEKGRKAAKAHPESGFVGNSQTWLFQTWLLAWECTNSERKRHINFFSRKLSVPPFVPRFVPGTNWVCSWDKPGENRASTV